MAEMKATLTVMGTNMTLRDWFAGQVLCGFMSNQSPDMTSERAELTAAISHAMADEMMRLRNQPAEAEDPWRDLTDEEVQQVGELAAREGLICGSDYVGKMWDAMRKVRGGD